MAVYSGMVANELLMPFPADVLGVPPTANTALQAAYAPGLTVGF